MTHLENVYRLACDLRFEFRKALNNKGVINSRSKKYDEALSELAHWALVNLHEKDELNNADSKESDTQT